MPIKVKISLIAVAMAATILLAACPKKEQAPKPPEQIYNEAVSYMTRRDTGDLLTPPDYEKARETFQQILFEYPTSRYAPLAELRIADTYYEAGDYITAADQYTLWWRHHLGRPELPYAIYRASMSYYHLMLEKDRDQTYTRKALANFKYLIQNYPDNEYAIAVGEKVNILEVRLAQQEMYVGRFYFRHDRWWSAIDRFQTVLEFFPERGFDEEALFYIWRSYRKLGRFEQANATYHKMVENFPNGKYTRDARELEATEKQKGVESWLKP